MMTVAIPTQGQCDVIMPIKLMKFIRLDNTVYSDTTFKYWRDFENQIYAQASVDFVSITFLFFFFLFSLSLSLSLSFSLS